jgi:hypothetical protein
MNAEEKQQIQTAIREPSKTIWGYWPFLSPVIVIVIGIAIQVTLLAYFKYKIPDLEILIKNGSRIEPVYDSELVKRAVLTASFSIAVTGILFIYLARQSFRNLSLLKVAAKDLGISTND